MFRPIKFITLQTQQAGFDGTLESAEHLEHQETENAHFIIDPESVQLLASIEEPLCVISVAGIYRSGKSFLLNQLAGRRDGFNIGSTVEPCTQGIWMWLLDDAVRGRGADGCRYLLLDTEGLGSYIKTENYDVQIFSLALLLGSFFIYNSVNNIDEGAIDKLSLVVQLTKHIRAQAEGDDDPYHLKMYFPAFLWLVRDFALDLNINGKKVSPKEYLESALQPMKGDPSRVAGRNQVREFIKQFFGDRDCFTLKRPVATEEQLQNLQNLSDEELRPEYKEQLNELTDLIFHKATTKKIHGQSLNGPMFVELARSYIDAMNSGAMLTISTAWESVVAQECQKALDVAKKTYESRMMGSVSDGQVLEAIELEAAHRSAEGAALAVFRNKAVGGSYWQYLDELRKFIDAAHDHAIASNFENSEKMCERLLLALVAQIDAIVTTPMQNGRLTTVEDLELEWQRVLEQYEVAARGPAKLVVRARLVDKKQMESARRTHQTLLRDAVETHEQRLKQERERHEEEYRRVSKLYDEQMALKRTLETLVNQMSNDNAELSVRTKRAEDEARVLLHQTLKLQKKIENMETEQLEFAKHKVVIEEQVQELKKRGINVDAEKCIVM